MKAVIVDALNEYSVQEISLDPPKAGEVLVEMAATGVCHSDLSVINGTLPMPLPMVLGHEGAGVVKEVGEGVEGLEPGDHVVLSMIPVCGECYFCEHDQPHLCTINTTTSNKMLDGTSRAKRDDKELHVMLNLGCMAERVVVPQISCVKISKDIPLEAAALVGCGVMTGVGAALNTAQVTSGSTVAVFGCGGIGLSIIQGAKIAGAETIIAVDVSESKLEMAKKFGATHTTLGETAQDYIMELTHHVGADFAFEAVGVGALMHAAEAATRRGGTCTIVGVGKISDQFVLNPLLVPLQGKTIKGSLYGSANPPKDFPKMLGYYQDGKLNLDDMITKTYTIDEVQQAFSDMEAGTNARGVIVYNK